jgi:hypothetical protein
MVALAESYLAGNTGTGTGGERVQLIVHMDQDPLALDGILAGTLRTTWRPQPSWYPSRQLAMPRNSEVTDRVQALEDELRIIRQVLSPKARLALALARMRKRARGTSSHDIAVAADRAVRSVRRASSRGPG